MKQHLLKHNLFAFYLTDDTSTMDSDLTFGYYDRTKYTGNMHWSPVLFKYMFGIQLDDILINGESVGLCGSEGINKTNCLITVDSGTSYMSMPTWAEDVLRGRVPTVEEPVDCNTPAEFGTFTWVINGKDFTFEPDEWIYPPAASLDLPPTAYDDNGNTLS